MARPRRKNIFAERRLLREIRALPLTDIYRQPPQLAKGQGVLLLPGLYAGDRSLVRLFSWLRRAGYRPFFSGIAINIDCSEKLTQRLEKRLERVYEKTGAPVLLIGQSRGGQIGQVLCQRRPELVAGLIALGTPFLDPIEAMHPWLYWQTDMVAKMGNRGLPGVLSDNCREELCCRDWWQDHRRPFPRQLPFVVIYSRSDGLIDWRSCLHPDAEQIEVRSTHSGMATNPEVYLRLAQVLAAWPPASGEKPDAS